MTHCVVLFAWGIEIAAHIFECDDSALKHFVAEKVTNWINWQYTKSKAVIYQSLRANTRVLHSAPESTLNCQVVKTILDLHYSLIVCFWWSNWCDFCWFFHGSHTSDRVTWTHDCCSAEGHMVVIGITWKKLRLKRALRAFWKKVFKHFVTTQLWQCAEIKPLSLQHTKRYLWKDNVHIFHLAYWDFRLAHLLGQRGYPSAGE